MVYLDNSATTAVCAAAVERMTEVMTCRFGNPSSLHRMGIAAEEDMTQARREVGALLGASPEQVVFTGGGTESNNLAILGGAQARVRSSRKAVTTMGEHASVAACFDELERQGWQVTRIPLGTDGSVTPKAIEDACDEDTALVSVMMVNNETGALLDVAETVKRVKRRAPQALFHTDGVQAAGKLPLKADRWGVDLLSASSHKVHGPKGCGALYIRKGVRLIPRQIGGGQERGLRSGTEATPAIAGFGAAAAAVPPFPEQEEHYRRLREALLSGVGDLPNIRYHLPERGVPYIVNLSVMGFRSETLLHFLAQREIYVSGGSACSRGKRSPVLSAMGLPEPEIDSALRISFCRDNTMEDVQALCGALHEAVGTLKRRT
jgi:cysteine desulfurase